MEYRTLNKITINNGFPIIKIEDLFDKLQGYLYISRIDLKSGILPHDVHKIALFTIFGFFEYLVMPFGLTNAPITFNKMMDNLLRLHIGVFFDNVIVCSKSIEEHKMHLQEVSQVLRDNKLYMNLKKGEFFLEEIQYLGHLTSKSSIRMDLEKLEVLKEWPVPRNIH